MYYYTIIHNKTQKHAFHVFNFQEFWKDFRPWKFWKKKSIRLLRSFEILKFLNCLMKYCCHNLYIIIIFCRLGINISWDGLIIVVNSVGSRRARQETIKALSIEAENHKINLNLSQNRLKKWARLKKESKPATKGPGTKTKSDIKRKTGMVARLVKLCKWPHYLFLQDGKRYHTEQRFYLLKRAFYETTIILPPIKA